MPAFGPELIQLMRGVLEEVMTKVPVEASTPAVKAHLAECILKAAAQGHTSYGERIGADSTCRVAPGVTGAKRPHPAATSMSATSSLG
jgi:hypothetical protein